MAKGQRGKGVLRREEGGRKQMLKSRKVSRRNVYYYAHLQRLHDAQALFEKRRWVGCIYMAGIAVECVLKYEDSFTS